MSISTGLPARIDWSETINEWTRKHLGKTMSIRGDHEFHVALIAQWSFLLGLFLLLNPLVSGESDACSLSPGLLDSHGGSESGC